MPTPGASENRSDFVSRCMGHDETKRKHPDQDERLAVCNGIFDQARKSVRTEVSATGEITKLDADRQVVYGWASVIEEDGEPVVDLQGDVIKEASLYEAAHAFVTDSRAGKMNHSGRRVADVVESVVFTKDLQKALGVDLGKVGWLIGMKVRDDETWKMVKSGALGMFSVGGYATRVEMTDG